MYPENGSFFYRLIRGSMLRCRKYCSLFSTFMQRFCSEDQVTLFRFGFGFVEPFRKKLLDRLYVDSCGIPERWSFNLLRKLQKFSSVARNIQANAFSFKRLSLDFRFIDVYGRKRSIRRSLLSVKIGFSNGFSRLPYVCPPRPPYCPLFIVPGANAGKVFWYRKITTICSNNQGKNVTGGCK